MEEDQKRADYEAALRGVVDAMHGVVTSFETLALAGRAWDPENTKNGGDVAVLATIASSGAMMRSVLSRYPGAAQLLGIEELVARMVARANAEACSPASPSPKEIQQ